MNSKKKMGRPTEKPLIHDIKVRLDEETFQKLIEFCKENSISKAEAIRKWISEGLSK